MQKYALLVFVITIMFCQVNAQELLFEEGFESGELNIKASGNTPEVIFEDACNGSYVMKSQLSNNSLDPKRTEVTLNTSELNFGIEQEYWMGLSVKLDEDFNLGDFFDQGIILQWHYRDWDYFDEEKPQPLVLRYNNGEILIQNEWVDTSGSNKSRELGSVIANIGDWEDWVINLRFSNTNGMFKVWRNGDLIVDWSGDNHYVERPDGAYVKWGLYSYQYDDINYPDKYERIPVGYSRTVYHDEVSIAGSEGSYEIVAPTHNTPTTRISNNLNKEGSILIYNQNGVIRIESEKHFIAKVYSLSGKIVKETSETSFSLESSGFYIVRIESKKEVKVKKIFIAND
jgi:hypothetical protein